MALASMTSPAFHFKPSIVYLQISLPGACINVLGPRQYVDVVGNLSWQYACAVLALEPRPWHYDRRGQSQD